MRSLDLLRIPPLLVMEDKIFRSVTAELKNTPKCIYGIDDILVERYNDDYKITLILRRNKYK